MNTNIIMILRKLRGLELKHKQYCWTDATIIKLMVDVMSRNEAIGALDALVKHRLLQPTTYGSTVLALTASGIFVAELLLESDTVAIMTCIGKCGEAGEVCWHEKG